MFGLQLTIYCNHKSWTRSTCFPVLDYNRFFWTHSKSCHGSDEFTAKNRCFLTLRPPTLPPPFLSVGIMVPAVNEAGALSAGSGSPLALNRGGGHISSARLQGWAKRSRILFTSWPNSTSWHHWSDVNRGTQEPFSSDAKNHFHRCPP